MNRRPLIFPPSRAIPTDGEGNPLFVNRDTIAEPGEPTATSERPYDKKKTYERLYVPPEFINSPNRDEDPLTRPAALTPSAPSPSDVPPRTYPYRPSHGPKFQPETSSELRRK